MAGAAGPGMSRGIAETPLVSVIIPAWNAQDTLAETLRSVANQTHRELEILIVDDGSTDRTAAIAGQFCAGEPRARLIRKDNGGVASARNAGIAVAMGEWIAPIDSDDLWHPARVEKMIAVALAAPESPGFVYCWSRMIDSEGRITGSGETWRFTGRAFGQHAYLNAVGNGSALLIATDAIRAIGGYDATLRGDNAQGAEDWLVQMRIARTHPVALVPEYLVGWRRTGRNMSDDAEQMHRACRLIFDRLAAAGISLPRHVPRRVEGKSAFDVADHFVGAGKLGAGIRWLAQALWLDPLRCGLLATYRVARAVRRRIGAVPPSRQPSHFYDVDPAIDIPSDPYQLAGFSGFLSRLEQSRLNRLTRLMGRRYRGFEGLASSGPLMASDDPSQTAGTHIGDRNPGQRELS